MRRYLRIAVIRYQSFYNIRNVIKTSITNDNKDNFLEYINSPSGYITSQPVLQHKGGSMMNSCETTEVFNSEFLNYFVGVHSLLF